MRLRVDGSGGSGCREFAHMRNIEFPDRAKLLGGDRGNGHCFSGERHELDFKCIAVAMNMNNRSDIAGFKTGVRKIRRQNHAIVFADFHFDKG